MASIYRETFTKPLPAWAELFTRSGQRLARWTDAKGRKHTERVTTPETGPHAGTDRLLIEAATYTARYRDGAGLLVKVSTGCRDADAARAVLAELERRAELVRAGVLTGAEDSAATLRRSPLATHVEAYLTDLAAKRGKGSKPRVAPRHVAGVRRCLNRVLADCGFKLLRDLTRAAVERWADQREADGMAAKTLNHHLAAITAFGNWCVERGRLVANPFNRPPKRDVRADPRRPRRALSADELRRLLYAAQLRPLAERGRASMKRADAADRADKRSRRTWTKAPLTAESFGVAVAAARTALAGEPELVADLERRGRTTALVYKALVLTGLRRGELASLTVGQVDLDGATPVAVLNAADEKAGRGAEIPLRPDLAADLSRHLAERLRDAQRAARREGRPIPVRLPADAPLFALPTDLIRRFDLDAVAAGLARRVRGRDRKGRECWRIEKRDERGRSIDLHSLRHTFGTHLSKGGVAPRTAQAAMRHSTLDLTMNVYTDPKLARRGRRAGCAAGAAAGRCTGNRAPAGDGHARRAARRGRRFA